MIDNLIFPLDYIITAIGIIIIIICLLRGIIGSILGLLTWIGSILITVYFFTDLSNFINSQLLNIKALGNYEQITNLLSSIISIPLIFLISLFILKRIRKLFTSDLDKKILGIMIDKLFGFVFGFIFNYIVFTTLLYFTYDFELLNFINNWLLENSYLLNYLDNFNDNLINSIFGLEQEIIN
tara:strand:+ start:201 stop:746 length:546 start_codon:yes stop_codon:yes gene_type:complete